MSRFTINNNENEFHDEDIRIQFILNHCHPREIPVDDIKLRTHRKLANRSHRRIRLLIVSAAASVAIILSIVLFPRQAVVQEHPRQIADKERVEPLKLLTTKVPTGKTMTIILADGTKITANSRSKVTYPSSFNGKFREVSIDGEAYLEVAHNRRHPFIVHGHGFNLRVLGTKFNVNTYNDCNSTVALVEGAVEITTQCKDVIRLRPNHLVSIKRGTVGELVDVNAADYTSWIQGIMKLNGQTLSQITRDLENYYGISITCSPNIARQRLYGKLELDTDMRKALKSISFLSESRCIVNGSKVRILK